MPSTAGDELAATVRVSPGPWRVAIPPRNRRVHTMLDPTDRNDAIKLIRAAHGTPYWD
jgi:hypothetical protein